MTRSDSKARVQRESAESRAGRCCRCEPERRGGLSRPQRVHMALETTAKRCETMRGEKLRGTRPVAAIPRFCKRTKLPLETFAEQMGRQAEERASRLDARERELDGRAERLRDREARLAAWEHRIRTRRMSGAPPQAVTKVGRNEGCPCGSGLKYKHCHGLAGR